MSMMEYDIRFIQLSCYAQYLVLTKEKRIKRLVRGLIKPLFKVIVAKRFATYSVVVHAARLIESYRIGTMMERNRARKATMDSRRGQRDSSETQSPISMGRWVQEGTTSMLRPLQNSDSFSLLGRRELFSGVSNLVLV
ncbi:uncharacterized protein LOC110426394 [Herrania umbratica]|uniref:Uncharacterized protein LOC110426394 n=1 Tax=Herrania umbratica TaxID=108875 RepID=A0A6J1BDS8_9ROSI|nr:uncharacterized protein LOC110426394 [Herrania umbratica]